MVMYWNWIIVLLCGCSFLIYIWV